MYSLFYKFTGFFNLHFGFYDQSRTLWGGGGPEIKINEQTSNCNLTPLALTSLPQGPFHGLLQKSLAPTHSTVCHHCYRWWYRCSRLLRCLRLGDHWHWLCCYFRRPHP